MRKLSKIVFISILIFAAGLSAFAKGKFKPNENEIILVGRINVIYDEDREFIYNTRGIDKADLDKPDTYTVPYIDDPSDSFGSNASKYYKDNDTEVPVGDFYIVHFKKPKKSENLLSFRRDHTMYFFGSTKAKIYLPIPAKYDVEIPDGVLALYIGSFNYYVTGDNFTIENFENVDEFDLAQEELDRVLGEHCDMARAVLKVVENN